MHDWKSFFKGKKVTVMGLDLEGRGIRDVTFLAEAGAQVIATDLKTADMLEASLAKVRHYENVTFVLGEHRLEDFRNRDLIIRAASAPLGSPFLEEARKQGTPIETDETLFFATAPELVTIGITGTRGKSTTTHMLYDIFKKYFEGALHQVFVGGNVRGTALLPLLPLIEPKDIFVLELSSWQLQGFGEKKLSPHIAVFTTFMPDHMNYYKNDLDAYLDDKAQIFKYQTEKDFLILGKQVAPIVKEKYGSEIRSYIIEVDEHDLPQDWTLQVPGVHNRYNAALAAAAATCLGVDQETIKEAIEHFKAIPGRLELVKETGGVKIFNDTNSTTPDALRVGLKAMEKPPVLIMGGNDKLLDFSEALKDIAQTAKAVFLIPGTGSDRIAPELEKLQGVYVERVATLKEAVEKGIARCDSGDSLLFSPGFTSFGQFKNEYDRGEQFNTLVAEL